MERDRLENKSEIFRFLDYRKYLKEEIAYRDGKSRGFRSRLADQAGFQRTFLSQVLNGTANFNLEHGEAVSQVLGHTNEEADFFMLLILHARSGTQALRDRIQAKINSALERRMVLKNRFNEKDVLSLEDRIEYYGSWIYGALRVLLTIPRYQSRAEVERYFGLPRERIEAALDFLISRGLVRDENGRLEATQKHMYLGNDSRLVSKHHMNWKLRAIDSLDDEKKTDLHFSAVNSLSREDVLKVREALARTLEEIRETVKASNPECLYAVCFDFFEL